MTTESQAIENIYNYKKANEQIITAGQPSEEQLRAVAKAGFNAVINISTNDPRYALPDEEGLVRSLGLQYRYLPVVWDNPTPENFEQFATAMEQLAGQKTLVHCAANYRASAFYALYAMTKKDWSEAQVDDFIASLWQPHEHPQWLKFIDTIKQKIKENQF
jgi:protein tyrosine phosphatase (PTP) superfamily phosphohydrolase (DUF442 family)